MNRVLAANWKMNLGLAESRTLFAALGELSRLHSGISAIVFPPATVLATLAASRRPEDPSLGGQNCHPEPRGAFTGEVSAEQLRDAGAEYVLVGHSERASCSGRLPERLRGRR